MNDKIMGSPVERSLAEPPPVDRGQHDLPDRWCFGLSHPYIQRLIFLAGILEKNTTINTDEPP